MQDAPHLVDGPDAAPLTVALAHGAGALMDSPFMAAFAEGLAASGYRTVRFEFPYMAKRRADGRSRPPDRTDTLLAVWRAVIADLGPDRLVIGGKSLGGRMATMIADEAGVYGAVVLGYPFHPPGKPDAVRTDHLADLRTPTLILQGTRDSLGNVDDVAGYALSSVIRVHWLADGDHSFVPRKTSGRTEDQNREEALGIVSEFLAELAS